jgi:hypothetical protein
MQGGGARDNMHESGMHITPADLLVWYTNKLVATISEVSWHVEAVISRGTDAGSNTKNATPRWVMFSGHVSLYGGDAVAVSRSWFQMPPRLSVGYSW